MHGSGEDALAIGKAGGPASRPLIIAAMVTPFSDTGIDDEGFQENLRYVRAGGVDGVLVAGTTGEKDRLRAGERDRLVRLAREIMGSEGLVIAGQSPATLPDFEPSRDARAAAECGADRLLVAPDRPPKDDRDEDAVYESFRRLTAASPVPVLAYHPPSYRRCPLSRALRSRLAGLAGLRGVKDSTGEGRMLLDWRCDRAERSTGTAAPFEVLVGNARLFLGEAVGVDGAILALASVRPEPFVAASRCAGDAQALAAIEDALRPDLEAFASGGLEWLKRAHEELGLFGGDAVRS